MALKVDNPASFLISGPSGIGKSHWIFRLIEHRNEIFTEKIEKIFYFYDTYQKKFDQFVDSIDGLQLRHSFFPPKRLDVKTPLQSIGRYRKSMHNSFSEHI